MGQCRTVWDSVGVIQSLSWRQLQIEKEAASRRQPSKALQSTFLRHGPWVCQAQDSDVVLLVAVVDEQSPRHLRFRHCVVRSLLFLRIRAERCSISTCARDQLEGAAQVLLRAARIVAVDGRAHHSVMTEYGVTRGLAEVSGSRRHDI